MYVLDVNLTIIALELDMTSTFFTFSQIVWSKVWREILRGTCVTKDLQPPVGVNTHLVVFTLSQERIQGGSDILGGQQSDVM